ncbi:MAG TPA: MauE/DoxX family redox-associated membrane protein [Acidimicrobiales bacterium]|jgi:uncharacterized membrane protein YphA (DoxX/SURF4 family)|nr:MauE/DoxX family redox-associated membrane protein [Acidimicrobiales bacterium]
MEALAGPVIVCAALLVLAGALKIARPAPTAGALRAVDLPSALPLVRLLGAVEVVVGTTAAITLSPPLLALVAALYLGFATFVVVALARHAPLQSCGCFGQVDTPPSVLHLGLNLVSAGVAIAAAVTDTPNLRAVLADQQWHAVPFVLLVAICLYLCVALATVLPLTPRSSAHA